MNRSSRGVLVSDFDGTMTAHDFYQLVLERLVPRGEPDHWGRYLAGEITHFEAIAATIAAGRADEPTLAALADDMGLDPDLAAGVASLRAHGWDVVVASAGCAWYIERLLARAGVEITVHASPGRVVDGRLVMELPTQSPYFSPETGIDKEAVVRDALARGGPVAFAGDGRPDFGPACLVPERFRFARGFLAERLKREGIPFRRFVRWSEIARALVNEPLG